MTAAFCTPTYGIRSHVDEPTEQNMVDDNTLLEISIHSERSTDTNRFEYI